MTDKDEIASLKARVAELEAKAKPPPPFKPEPFQRWDPTSSMSMPRSAMEAMAKAVPDAVIRDIAAHGTIPGPSGQASGQVTKVSSSPGTGWREATPLRSPPGVAAADRLRDAQDAKDRQELIMQHARMKAAQKLAEEKP
jgi:hypothetical protein